MAGTPKPIGRILIIPKGSYDPSTPYNSLDLVRYDSKSWLCKTDGIIGITPTEGTDWTLMTEDGTDGRGIVNIQRTGTDPSNPLKDIYTITYTDGTTSTFTVTNGSGGGTTADTMLKSVYDTDDDGIVDKADSANTATNATDATNAKNLKNSDGTTVDADTITTKLSKSVPTTADVGKVATVQSDGTIDWETPSASITEPTDLEKNIIGCTDDKWVAQSYTKGATVIYNNKIYVCIADCAASNEPTDSNYWEETSISALNSKLKFFPDFARKLTLTDGTWTAPEDCWYNYLCMDSKEPYSLKIDNVVVSTSDKSGGVYTSYACGFAKRGSVFTNEYLSKLCKAFPLK